MRKVRTIPLALPTAEAIEMAWFSWKYIRRYLREALAALLFVTAVGVGIWVYFSDHTSFHRELTITGGSSSGLRSQIARRLAGESRKEGVRLRVVDSEGSKEALERVDQGVVDLALVQGGLDPSLHRHVRQLATLHIEPLHLVVKPDLHSAAEGNLANLRGKSVNVSTPGSGTHDLAIEVLRFAGLHPHR